MKIVVQKSIPCSPFIPHTYEMCFCEIFVIPHRHTHIRIRFRTLWKNGSKIFAEQIMARYVYGVLF